MNDNKILYTITIFSENTVGVLNQISTIFTRRQLNIETLSVSPSAITGIHKFTITTLSNDEEVMKKLARQIDKRVDIMVSNGLVDEVKKLKAMGCTSDMVSMKGIGYKEILAYLDGEYSLDEAVDKVKLESRRFAKRQLTWFRREKDTIWIEKNEYSYDDNKILNKIQEILAEKRIIIC